ncbi:cathepsin O-like, partial [Homalodisca vitripennis]
FQNSLKMIEELNSLRSGENSAYYGLTEFSDLSQEEFMHYKLHPLLSKRLRKHPGHYVSATFRNHDHHHNRLKKRAVESDLPQKVDWREKGAVTPVNNQKTCGACWAFSTVQTVESMNFLKTGQLIKLSVQQAIDCARNGNMGCDGGDTCSLLMWLANNKIKLQPATSYPLVLETQMCKLKKSTIGVQVASNYTCDYLVGDEDTLLSLLAYHGPVAVAVNALSWQYYLGGVIQFHCDGSPQNLNHAVQIIGYDLTAPIPHYIVRNSWGTTYGDNGYLYLAVGSNICGLATEVTGLDVV